MCVATEHFCFGKFCTSHWCTFKHLTKKIESIFAQVGDRRSCFCGLVRTRRTAKWEEKEQLFITDYQAERHNIYLSAWRTFILAILTRCSEWDNLFIWLAFFPNQLQIKRTANETLIAICMIWSGSGHSNEFSRTCKLIKITKIMEILIQAIEHSRNVDSRHINCIPWPTVFPRKLRAYLMCEYRKRVDALSVDQKRYATRK